ncbi:MAG: putative lipid II flippase FtsW [Actinobacteria bacterium]|nr:putative lipid II flippase FtsW [Actinomycetota bacterium]
MKTKNRGLPIFSFYFLLSLVLTISIFGLVMISSAGSVVGMQYFGDSLYFLKRQVIYFLVAVVIMLAVSFIDHRILARFSFFFMAISILLLIVIILPGFGFKAGGATRWIRIGFFNLQPSELTKIFFVLFCAGILTRKKEKIGAFKHLFMPVIFVALLVSGLVFLQPDLSTVLVIWMGLFSMLFVSGAKLKHIIVIIAGWIAVVLVYIFSASYRIERIFSFLNRGVDAEGAGFQLQQSLIAIGSGGIFGVGLGASRQKFLYLPEAQTDFIFSIVGEEFGLVGAAILVGLYMAIFIISFTIAFRTKDRLSRLLVVGISTTICGQALINILSVIGVIPITGVPLPMVSFGGSSLTMTLFGIGVILNIIRNLNRSELRLVDEIEEESDKEIIDMRWRNRGAYISGSVRHKKGERKRR